MLCLTSGVVHANFKLFRDTNNARSGHLKTNGDSDEFNGMKYVNVSDAPQRRANAPASQHRYWSMCCCGVASSRSMCAPSYWCCLLASLSSIEARPMQSLLPLAPSAILPVMGTRSSPGKP